MRHFLLFLSSIIALFAFHANAEEETVQIQTQTQHYSFQIETNRACISGILIVRNDDESIRGSIVNEFGVSAIDFIYSKKKQSVKILNVVSFLDKWYIKPVLKKDIRYCLHVLYDIPYSGKNKYEIENKDSLTVITNTKRHLKYSFSPLLYFIKNDDTEE